MAKQKPRPLKVHDLNHSSDSTEKQVYDLSNLSSYLELTPPSEIAKLLDNVLFDLVASAELMQSYDSLHQKYVDVLLLRDEFAMLDEDLRKIWK